ncbi:MAG TPA: SAM-dependent methyltransferase, partial [Candidatus Binataceae bacterium]|nr:SAM-dependent methyltransferase [Candidatus Binataceae bacterium]
MRNSERTLEATLDSLIAQTDAAWEALIVDDGSLDGTANIITTYSNRDPRFKGLVGPAVGASGARNTGLAHASGHRVLFLDGDDQVDARFLKEMNATLDAAPDAAAAYCNYCRVLPDGKHTPIRSDWKLAEDPFEVFARRCAVTIHSVLINRRVLDAAGGFDPTLRTCEDWDLWQRVARVGGRWIHVDMNLSYYRISDHSLTQNVEQMLADAQTVIARGFSARQNRIFPFEVHPGANTEFGTAKQAYACFALWCAAFDCGRGRRPTVSFEYLRDLPQSPDLALAIVEILFDAVIAGRRTLPERLAAEWPEFGRALTDLIEGIGQSWNDLVASRRVQYRFESYILDYDTLAQPRSLGLTLGMRVDLRHLATVDLPAGVDRLYVHLCAGREVKALLVFGSLGCVTRRRWLELAIAHMETVDVIKSIDPWLRPIVAMYALAYTLRDVARTGKALLRHDAARRLFVSAARKALLRAVSQRPLPGSHEYSLMNLRRLEAEAAARSLRREMRKPDVTLIKRVEKQRSGDRPAFWEDLFKEGDPWNYRSAYEQEKYARQLAILPKGTIGAALELACAEGLFTAQLAPHVDRLIAADISTTALARAKEHCKNLTNVHFEQLDLTCDALPDGLDLIICAEVLYYLENETELERVAKRLMAALRPGGHIIIAHAYVLKDDMSRSGFDWDNPFGAKKIAEVFETLSGLELEQSTQTELYRIDRYVVNAKGQSAADAKVDILTLNTEIEPEVARFILWGGAIARRSTLAVTEQHHRVPVLMYHSVADDGAAKLARYRVSRKMFQSQMAWLRRHGYHSISAEELAWFIANKHPFVGRPVVISFDDGYQDFADNAWRILQVHDFRPEVFIVTDFVGGVAKWDANAGPPAALMNAPTIARLAMEGVYFGSHLASHRAADGLSTEVLAAELTRS